MSILFWFILKFCVQYLDFFWIFDTEIANNISAKGSTFGQESCSAANSLKLIPPAEAGKGEGKEEIFSGISVTSDTSNNSDTFDTMAPGAGRGEGGEIPDEGGRERESATMADIRCKLGDVCKLALLAGGPRWRDSGEGWN